jgi:predicted dehydrogenase
MNWGIIGLGNIAKEFAEAMNKTKPVYAVAARNYDKAKAFTEQFEVNHVYSSYEELLNDENIEIVYIATVNSQHYKHIMMCLEAGKHVFCEKAIWGNYEELKKAYEYAKNKNLLLCEAMTIYHMPLFRKIKELISDGVLGTIKLVEADLGSLKEDDPKNRFFSKELGGGAMLDIGTYTLSFLRYFLEGEINEVRHVMHKYSTGVDEMWSIGIKTSTGELGNANMTFRAKLPKRGVIAGDKAYIVVYNYVRADKAQLVYPDGESEEIEVGKTADALGYEIIDIEKAVMDQKSGLDYMKETLEVVKLMDQLLRDEKIN